MEKNYEKVAYFDLFDTLVTADRGKLEPYFTREVDRLGDNGVLKNATQTIQMLADIHPDLLDNASVSELATYYEDRMSYLLSNVRPDVLGMLEDLKNDGWKLCVISDAARVDIAGWEQSPLSKYFDATVFSCDTGYVKPDPRLFEHAKQIMGYPKECVFIGDGGHEELKGAQRAGMATIKAEYIKNRRDEEINRYADVHGVNARKIASQARQIDFSEHTYNKESPYFKAITDRMARVGGTPTFKEETDRASSIYDAFEMAAHRIGKDASFSPETIQEFTDEILGKTDTTETLDQFKKEVYLLRHTYPEEAHEIMSNMFINAGSDIVNGVDSLRDERESSEAIRELASCLADITQLFEEIGVELDVEDVLRDTCGIENFDFFPEELDDIEMESLDDYEIGDRV